MVDIVSIERIAFRIRNRETGEGVSHPNDTIGLVVRHKDGAHIDTCSPSPNPCLNNVARNLVFNCLLDEIADVSHPNSADHGLRMFRPVSTEESQFRIE